MYVYDDLSESKSHVRLGADCDECRTCTEEQNLQPVHEHGRRRNIHDGCGLGFLDVLHLVTVCGVGVDATMLLNSRLERK